MESASDFVSSVSSCVPLSDITAARQVATSILYLHIVYAVLASLGWAYNAYTDVTLIFALFALFAMEVNSTRFLKLYTVMTVVLWFFDIFWLALWAGKIDSGSDALQAADKKYHTTSQLVLAMVCLMFITRTAEIFVWLKMADMDYGEGAERIPGGPAYSNIGPPKPPDTVNTTYRPFSFADTEQGGGAGPSHDTPPPATGAGGYQNLP